MWLCRGRRSREKRKNQPQRAGRKSTEEKSGLDGEGLGDGLGIGEGFGKRGVFEGFAHLADYAFAGEGFLEEASVLEEIVAGGGLFEVAGHIDEFEMGMESFEAPG